MEKRPAFQFGDVHEFLVGLFENDLHAKRIYSLSNAALGVMTSASLGIHAIGHALAQARSLVDKHAIKQVDRLLSNPGIDTWEMFAHWVPYMVGKRSEIVVALDWTCFDRDGHDTLALNLVTKHGRSTPLVWMSVEKSELKNRRGSYERQVLFRLYETLPKNVSVTVLADRGFGDRKLFEYLTDALEFDYLIRIRGNIHVTNDKGITRPAQEWLTANGRARTLRNATITTHEHPVPTVVCVHDKAMKEPWCLCSSKPDAKARELINAYAKRWSIETTFRDTKDLRFGMGMKNVRVRSTERRDRLFLLSAFAIMLLTLLGAASENLGMDRLLRANTVKHRTHSLFCQGCSGMTTSPICLFNGYVLS